VGLTILGWVAAFFLGGAAALLIWLIIPSWFGVETWCLFDGDVTAAANSYSNGVTSVSLIAWLMMVVAMTVLQVRRRDGLGALLPLAWFVSVCAIAAVGAASIGPQPCSGGDIGALF
jgi:hypothetical protein